MQYIVFVSDSFDLQHAFASTMSTFSNCNYITAAHARKYYFTVHHSTYRGLYLSMPTVANAYAYSNNHTTAGRHNVVS